MANVRNEERPLSPHATVYKIGPHMLVSFVHRLTGTGLAIGGSLLLIWWLAALASGAATYAAFVDVFTVAAGGLNILGYVVGIGLSWLVFQHMASGVRHLFLDQGANFELKGNRATAILTFAFSVVATIAFWVVILEKSNG
ncbi:MAG: succinate dehydrogenase, cytochrome b556 subunit [Sphingomonas sp.]